jgi:hypothetical protein
MLFSPISVASTSPFSSALGLGHKSRYILARVLEVSFYGGNNLERHCRPRLLHFFVDFAAGTITSLGIPV